MTHERFGPKGRETRALTIVGVARDVRSTSLVDGLAEPFMYVPLQQNYSRDMTTQLTIAARTTGGQRRADEIRALVAAMDPNLSVTSQTLEDATRLGLVPQRVAASLAGSLGLFGVVLAAIGIYGLAAYAVTRRTREFGIRIALGARPADLVVMVLKQGLAITAAGSVIGVLLAIGVSRVLAVFLLGMSPIDPLVFATAVVLFAAVGLLASYGPARRTTRIDPMTAVRSE
jgi:predicted lysophospholipase L1 biosynthesis ABC-type transport system permease subunit